MNFFISNAFMMLVFSLTFLVIILIACMVLLYRHFKKSNDKNWLAEVQVLSPFSSLANDDEKTGLIQISKISNREDISFYYYSTERSNNFDYYSGQQFDLESQMGTFSPGKTSTYIVYKNDIHV